MKKCPFCDTENEDNVNECVICGTELAVAASSSSTISTVTNMSASMDPNAVDENSYSVLLGANSYKGIISEVKKFLNIDIHQAKADCERGQIDGLTQEKAESLAAKIRGMFHPARAVKADMIETYKEGISLEKSWKVKIGAQTDKNRAVVEFCARYFGLDEGITTDHLRFSVEDGDGTIYQTDCATEAEELARKLCELGAEAMFEEGKHWKEEHDEAIMNAEQTMNEWNKDRKMTIVGIIVAAAIVLGIIIGFLV